MGFRSIQNPLGRTKDTVSLTVSFPVKRMVEESLTGGGYRGAPCQPVDSVEARILESSSSTETDRMLRFVFDAAWTTVSSPKKKSRSSSEKSAASARFSAVARRYSVFLYLPFLWILRGSTLGAWNLGGLFFLILLILLTLIAPVLFIYRGGQYSGDMARLTPSYDRPKGH